ncbi:hypothetical protein ACTFIU_002348 [Dictyostelium citrinum]
MTLISYFSDIKFGILIYFIYISSFIVGIIGIIKITTIQSHNHNNDQWPYTLAITGFLIFGLSFILSLIRILTSDITKSLKNFRKNENQNLQDYINGIEECSVELYCKCECYHINRGFLNQSSSSKKVITHREEIKIPIIESVDLTNPLILDEINLLNNCDDSKYLKVSFFRDWMPDDERSQTIIKSIVDHLTLKNENKDIHFKIYLDFQYIDKKFKEHILFPLSTSSKPPFLFRYGFYYLSLFIFMCLPYELYFLSKIYKSEFSFVKLIKTSDDVMQSVQPLIPIQNNQFQTHDNNFYTLNEQQFNNIILQKQYSTINLSKDNRVLQKQLSNLSMDITF